jgi:TRAP transporter 4TM/12TM fusion protein
MRQLSRPLQRLTHVLLLIWGAFIVYTARMALHPLIQAPIFLGFGLVLAFIYYPWSKRISLKAPPSPWDWACVVISAVGIIHVAINYEYFLIHPAESTTFDLVIGSLLVLLAMEAARRAMGPVIPLIAIFMILYTFLGQYLPGPWGHSGFSYRRTVEFMYMTTNGLWGNLAQIVCTLIAVFMLFGGTLLATGAGSTLINLTTWLGGRMTGGGAKVALFASAAIGTIQGSSVSNVATTGVFTIPMMKSQGFSNEFAAASESSASTGGQIMPPIMGAGAFIMSELIGIPYIKICVAAALPAIFYFFGVFMGIHSYAKKHGLGRLPDGQLREARRALSLRGLAALFIPLAVIVGMLVMRYTPQYAAFWAMLIAVAVYFFGTTRWSPQDVKARLLSLSEAFSSGARALIAISCLLMCVQIAVGFLTMTGIGVKLSDLVIGLAQEFLPAAIGITAVSCLIMGMGIPTTPAYILAAAVMGRTVIAMGLEPLTAHLFIFYYAILSVLTPPVCGAIFAASAMADSKWLPTAGIGVRLALPGYLVPFMFVMNPVLLIGVGGGMLTLEFAVTVVTSLLGIYCLSGAGMGYLLNKTSVPERVVLGIAALLLLVPQVATDIAGAVLFIVVALRQTGVFRKVRQGVVG